MENALNFQNAYYNVLCVLINSRLKLSVVSYNLF